MEVKRVLPTSPVISYALIPWRPDLFAKLSDKARTILRKFGECDSCEGDLPRTLTVCKCAKRCSEPLIYLNGYMWEALRDEKPLKVINTLDRLTEKVRATRFCIYRPDVEALSERTISFLVEHAYCTFCRCPPDFSKPICGCGWDVEDEFLHYCRFRTNKSGGFLEINEKARNAFQGTYEVYDDHAEELYALLDQDALRIRQRWKSKQRQLREKKANAVERILPAVIEQLATQQNNACHYCAVPFSASKNRFHVDHKKPLCRGGSNAASNLALACASCNSSKGALTEAEFRRYMRTGKRKISHSREEILAMRNKEAK